MQMKQITHWWLFVGKWLIPKSRHHYVCLKLCFNLLGIFLAPFLTLEKLLGIPWFLFSICFRIHIWHLKSELLFTYTIFINIVRCFAMSRHSIHIFSAEVLTNFNFISSTALKMYKQFHYCLNIFLQIL